MSKAVVAYFSRYGHTKRVAQAVAEGAQVPLIEIDSGGSTPEVARDLLDQVQPILFDAPTYMSSMPWQFKKFTDATSRKWFVRQWQDKVFGDSINSASLGGDKQISLVLMHMLTLQHDDIWVSLGLVPANISASSRASINNFGASAGTLAQLSSDADAQAIPSGNPRTVKLYAARVARIGQQLHA